MIEDLLLFSEIERQKSLGPMVKLSMQDMIFFIVNHYKSVWQERGIRIVFNFDQNMKPIEVDPNLMETVFKHLLLNSIQFNSKGGTIKIQAQARENGNSIVSFEDSGIGIPPEKLPQIFDSFFQVADYLTRKVGGLGLGLAIVKKIVDMHGGTIFVNSQLGKGSKFTVILPSSPIHKSTIDKKTDTFE